MVRNRSITTLARLSRMTWLSSHSLFDTTRQSWVRKSTKDKMKIKSQDISNHLPKGFVANMKPRNIKPLEKVPNDYNLMKVSWQISVLWFLLSNDLVQLYNNRKSYTRFSYSIMKSFEAISGSMFFIIFIRGMYDIYWDK